jgi:hypothetical protein
VVFNFCRTIIAPPCNGKMAGVIDDDFPDQCDAYGGNSTSEDIVAAREFNRQGDQEEGGLQLRYINGDTCVSDPSKKNSLVINLYCDHFDHEEKPQPSLVGLIDCEYIVKLHSRHACYKFTMNPFFRWIHKNENILGAVLIVIGVLVGLFGRPLFKPTICITTTLAFVVVSMLLTMSLFFNRDTKGSEGWIVFGVSFAIGCLIGLILAKLAKIGVAIIAAWGGFCLGLILYTSFVHKIEVDSHVVFWVFNVSLALGAGIISFIYFNPALIISTSIAGTYACIKGISFYAGGLPDEFELF